MRKQQTDTASSKICLCLFAPLIIFPLMINVRLFPMIAPNEEPKWGLLVLCGLWIVCSAAYLFWQKKEPLQLTWTWASLALFSFYSLLGMGVFVGPNTTEGWIRFSFWLASLMVFLTTAWAWRHEARFHDAWKWFISLGSFIFSAHYWKGYFLDYGAPNYNFSVLFSPIGHVNFTGDALVILLPVLIYLLLSQTHAVLRLLNWFSVTTVGAILLVASSRGALGGVVLGSLVVMILMLRHHHYFRHLTWKSIDIYLPAILLITALLSSMITYELLPYHYRDLARVSASVGSAIEDKAMKPLTPNVPQPPLAEMWHALTPVLGADRVTIYGSSTAMTMDAPILGQGTGNFFTVYPLFSNHYPDFRDALSSARTFTTNPHNIIFQIATQQGIPAAIIFIGLLLFFWGRLLFYVWKQWDTWLAMGCLGITAAIFDAMFNHVFFNPASMFVFALFAGGWWGGMKALPSLGKAYSLPSSSIRPIAVSCVIVALLLSIWPSRWLISEWYAGSAMSHMRQPSIANVEYQQAYAWDKDNFRAVFGVAQAAYQQKKYPEAIAYLEHFERIYPYNPPALNLLGAAYLMNQQYKEAGQAFQRAVNILPDFKMAQQNLARIQMILRQQPVKRQ
ncbi:MAG: O-antigen ligase family protein [Mariprofundaceae bacterium]|nr:O-antigen ligase family protein [Mariprofundaceae bacterium]